MQSSSITAIIVNFRTPALAMRAVDSMMSEHVEGCRLKAVLVDGFSEDGSCGALEDYCRSHPSKAVDFLPLDCNGGFAWANNQALLPILQRQDASEFIYLLNPDAIVIPGSLRPLVDLLRVTPTCAAAGSLLFDEGGSPRGSAFAFPTLRSEFARGADVVRLGHWLGVGEGIIRSDNPAQCDWVTGASVLLRSSALRDVGIFDDGFFLYFEESELMFRLKRAGWTIWHQPASRIVHVGGAATGLDSKMLGAKIAPRPPYWYRSRRRFFMLSRGRAIASLAAVAWMLGHGLRQVVRCLRKGRGKPPVTREFSDTVRYCLADVGDLAPSVPRELSDVGRAPAWMNRKG